jgi:hypothetical protein
MINLIQTTTTESLQSNGLSKNVVETHLFDDGRSVQFSYLTSTSTDSESVAQLRGQRIESELRAKEASIEEAMQGKAPLTKYQFRQLFSYTERLAIDAFNTSFESNLGLTEEQKKAIRTNLEDYNASSAVFLENPATIAGVNLYETLGLIAPGRAIEILQG